MVKWTLPHLSDEAFDREFHASVRQHDESSAVMMARLAEFDARKRYLPAGYGTMWDYCRLHEGWASHVVSQRLQAARTAREYPQIFDLLAAGKLDLCHVRLLAPHLTKENAAEMLAKAVDRSKRELEATLKPATVAIAPAAEENARNPEQFPRAPGHVEPAATFALEPPETAAAPTNAHSAELIPLDLFIDHEAAEILRHTQALLSHTRDHRDVGKIFKRALKVLNDEIETKRFGSAVLRKRLKNGHRNPRYIPMDVRRRVLLRDGFSCQHRGTDGHSCGSTHLVQFDHKITVAEGGLSTDDNLELVCAAHNRYRAEQRLGKKRIAAQRERAERERSRKRAGAAETAMTANTADTGHRDDVENGLVHTFRLRRSDAHEIAERVCVAMPGASLEATMKAALRCLAPVRSQTMVTPVYVPPMSAPA
jgi:hypothetical protein